MRRMTADAMVATARHPHSRQRVAVAAAFCGQGLVFISLTTKLPEIQDTLHIKPGTMSVLLLGLVLAAGVGSMLGEWLAPRRGSALALRLGFALMAVMLPLLALGSTIAPVAAAMAGYGLALGLVDAGTNMQGVAVEHEYGRPIMPTFHGAWTLGGIIGTLGSLATQQVSFEASALGLAVIPVLLVFAPYLAVGGPIAAISGARAAVPWRRIMLVGAAMVLFYMADTAITTWGPTYLDKQFLASASMVSVATLPYLAASLVGRGRLRDPDGARARDRPPRPRLPLLSTRPSRKPCACRQTLLLQQQRVPASAACAGGVCV